MAINHTLDVKTNSQFLSLFRIYFSSNDFSSTERYTVIPLKRLEDDFPTYSKSVKTGDVDTDNVDTETVKMGISPL